MTDLLVKVRGDGAAFRAAASRELGAAKRDIQPILTVPRSAEGLSLAGDEATWLRVSRADDGDNPWDAAHRMMPDGSPFAVDGARVEAVEPDIVQTWPWDAPGRADLGFGAAPVCAFDDQDGSGARPRERAPPGTSARTSASSAPRARRSTPSRRRSASRTSTPVSIRGT